MRRVCLFFGLVVFFVAAANAALASSLTQHPPYSRTLAHRSSSDSGIGQTSRDRFSLPSSPDDWLGGAGNWSADNNWSGGLPGVGSDVLINTGNDTVTLDVSASINSLTLGGTSGTSTLTNSGNSSLTIAGALTINQTGTLTLFSGSATAGGTVMNAGTVNLNNNSSISGATLVNSGNINVNVGFVNATGTLTNTGTIIGLDASDSVSSSNTFTNSGAINVYSVSVGGTLTNQGVISAQVLNVGGNLINQSSGTIEGFMPGSTMSVSGELANNGTVDSRYGSAVFGSLLNPGGGVIRSGADTVLGNVASDGNILVVSLGENEPPVSFEIGGNFITSGLLNVAGSGGTGASATAAGNITNTRSGIIEVDTLSSLDGASITNSGSIRTGVQGIDPGGNTVQANTLNNLAGGIIVLGGAGDTGQFGYINNAGSISIANGASLEILSSHAPTNAIPGFLNSGTVLISQGGMLFSPLTYSQTGGQTTVDGRLHVAGNGIVNFAGGAVYGNGGTIQGNVISNAMFNMGDMPNTVGMMAITGKYTQGANGSLAFDIASLTSFDQLNVSGHAQLNGLMRVDLLNGYIPQLGDAFEIMTYGSESGTFSMVVGLPINGQEHFVLEYNSTDLTLDVQSGQISGLTTKGGNGTYFVSEPFVSTAGDTSNGPSLLAQNNPPGAATPEPASVLLFGSGLAGFAGLLRQRSRRP
jgi:hypothetical protein